MTPATTTEATLFVEDLLQKSAISPLKDIHSCPQLGSLILEFTNGTWIELDIKLHEPEIKTGELGMGFK